MALWTRVPGLPIPVHNGLQDGRERSHANAGADQHRVLRAEDLGSGGAERTVDVHLRGRGGVQHHGHAFRDRARQLAQTVLQETYRERLGEPDEVLR